MIFDCEIRNWLQWHWNRLQPAGIDPGKNLANNFYLLPDCCSNPGITILTIFA